MKNIGADSVVYNLKASFHREDIIVFIEENNFFLVDHSKKFSSEK